MNFLSHYYVDHTDERPYYTLGLVMPDLAKIFRSSWRITPKILPRSNKSEVIALNEGIERHVEVDAVFHSSDFFKEYNSLINTMLGRGKLESVNKYVFFLSHVLFEMMLDRMLVKHFPHIGHQFYDQLEKVEKEVVEMYLKDLNFVEDRNEFFAFFERFRNSRYLLDYIRNESMIYALGRVFSRIDKVKFTTADAKLLDKVINELDERLADGYLAIFHKLNPRLKRVS